MEGCLRRLSPQGKTMDEVRRQDCVTARQGFRVASAQSQRIGRRTDFQGAGADMEARPEKLKRPAYRSTDSGNYYLEHVVISVWIEAVFSISLGYMTFVIVSRTPSFTLWRGRGQTKYGRYLAKPYFPLNRHPALRQPQGITGIICRETCCR